jgi:hypothetical protein
MATQGSVREGQDRITAESVLLGQVNGDWFAARYRIVCDLDWRVQKAEVGLIGDERQVGLITDGNGYWTNNQNTSLKELDGAIDIDISATPLYQHFTHPPVRVIDRPVRRNSGCLYPVARTHYHY